jgi:uncharacterized protein (TIGR02271 family)
VSVVANDAEDEGGTDLVDSRETGTSGEGIGQKVSNFFHSLTGGDEDVHHHYATGVNSGGALVGVTCPDEEALGVAGLLKQHGALELQTGGSSSQVPAHATESSATSAGETAIPIVEEQLVVGKREVDRGGVRVYSHVVEKPVSADVTLRDEKILVERRPVNRVASAADFNMGQGSVIELNATGEEAVVGKTARVVEEVLVGKTSTEHTEAVHDSVRRTEVEVEQIAGTTTNKF